MMRAILILVVAAACGSAPPKPRELETLEALRATKEAEASKRKALELVNESDRLNSRAKGNWKDGELERSRRDALLGWIKLKQAIAIWEQDEAKRRIEVADSDKARNDRELARMTKELNAVNDQISLMDKLANAKTTAEKERLKAEQEKAKLAADLAAQQQRGDAQGRIAAAELAVKQADTVDARTYAKAEYQAALDLIARANKELQEKNVSASMTSADQAKQKADQAAQIAKPEYQKATEASNRKAQQEALGKDAAALSGITVRMDRKGDVTRLVMIYGGAFKGKATTISGGKESVLDGVAELLKKYPTFPMQIIGHTDTKGRADANLVVSNARAQAVYNALIQRGVDPKRFVVSGVGSSQPMSDNKSAKGRAANNRVEMVFLYQ